MTPKSTTADDCVVADHFEKALGYRFADRGLLKRALTHASVRSQRSGGEDNERLEFLGDRVLALAIAELLVEIDPAATEGELARLFNRLVRKETCAKVGRDLGIGEVLILSTSENESGGRKKDTILADACEALLGAIFIEAGFAPARDCVRRLWMPLIEAARQTRIDPKSALQEWAQGRGQALPRYAEIERVGPDHAPRFRSEVLVGDLSPAEGEGASKRAAEQAAAAILLRREGVWRQAEDE